MAAKPITHGEIIRRIAEGTGLPKTKVHQTLELLVKIVSDELANERPCRVKGLGTFFMKENKGRIGRNPKTGMPIKIKKRERVRFRAGSDMAKVASFSTSIMELKEIADLMVSELFLYNSEEIDTGIRAGDLEERLKQKLADARTSFKKRIPEGAQDAEAIFEDALVRFLKRRSQAIAVLQ